MNAKEKLKKEAEKNGYRVEVLPCQKIIRLIGHRDSELIEIAEKYIELTPGYSESIKINMHQGLFIADTRLLLNKYL